MLRFNRWSRRSPAWLPCPPGDPAASATSPLFLAAALVLKLVVSMSSHIVCCAPRPILQLLSVSTLLAA
jgi:hypothetical protein